jgi:hypothetical protein
MKYKTLAELRAAYESGELSREHPLVLDNDCSHVYADGKQVYAGDGPGDLPEALDLLGIPWEPC